MLGLSHDFEVGRFIHNAVGGLTIGIIVPTFVRGAEIFIAHLVRYLGMKIQTRLVSLLNHLNIAFGVVSKIGVHEEVGLVRNLLLLLSIRTASYGLALGDTLVGLAFQLRDSSIGKTHVRVATN